MPSLTVYLKWTLDDSDGGIATWAVWPSAETDTVAPAPSTAPTDVIATMSPSGSESLSSRCKTVVRPSRAPSVSSLGWGGRFCADGCFSWLGFFGFLLFGLGLGGRIACQSSTWRIASSTTHTPPLARSLSTTCPRLTRKTGWLTLALDASFWPSAGLPSHERAYTPGVPPHAACTQPPMTTGRAGVPAPASNSVALEPPFSGTETRVDDVAR